MKPPVCLICMCPIEQGTARSSLMVRTGIGAGRPAYHHAHWQDCQAALRKTEYI